jgi:hypothetical protein
MLAVAISKFDLLEKKTGLIGDESKTIQPSQDLLE